HARPRLVIPPPPRVPDPATLAAAREAALDDLRLAGAGVRVTAAREALEQSREVLDVAMDGLPPWPGALNPAELKGGAKALASDACEAYRTAWAAYRSACADYHAGSALALIDALLSRYGAAYDDKK